MDRIEATGPWRFVALDVETANSAADSICQIGIALVGLDSAEYSKLVEDETVTKKKAMRSKRA